MARCGGCHVALAQVNVHRVEDPQVEREGDGWLVGPQGLTESREWEAR